MAYLSTIPPITDIQVISIQGNCNYKYHEAAFVFVLNDLIQLKLTEDVFQMHTNDVILLEPNTSFSLTGHNNNLVLLLRLNYDFWLQAQSGRYGYFVCNSLTDSIRDYSALRQLLSQISICYFECGANNDLRIKELAYSLLYYLTTYHFVADKTFSDGKESTRQQQILSYIDNNYMNEISLEDLSDAIHLAPNYLSRFFKKNIGTNFKTYLQEVRLNHALDDLKYTNATITAIAYNNGFPNANAFISSLRNKIGITPTEFRKSNTQDLPDSSVQTDYSVVEYENSSVFFKNILAESPEEERLTPIQFPKQIEYNIKDVASIRPINAIWSSLITVGRIESLHNAFTETQLYYLQENIGFHYARIESVVADLSIPAISIGHYNFSRFDRAISVLLSLKLKPVLELSARPAHLIINHDKIIYRGNISFELRPVEEYYIKVETLIRHCVNTFGIREVSSWAVELSTHFDETLQLQESPEEYSQRFSETYKRLKALVPDLLIGGPTYNITMDHSFIAQTLTILKEQNMKPDFISLSAFPYKFVETNDNQVTLQISSDPNYILDNIRDITALIIDSAQIHIPIWVTSLGLDRRSRNFLNDSQFQALFLAKNIVDLIDYVDILGYWNFSDINLEHIDTVSFLFGGTGLLSKNGLPKSGAIALQHFSAINNLLIRKGHNFLLTTNSHHTYNLVIFNYVHFNDIYCLSLGESVNSCNVYTFFQDAVTWDVNFVLNGLKPGLYKIRITSLSRDHGSLYDKWLQYGVVSDLDTKDIAYLRSAIHPHCTTQYITCTDGDIALRLQLLPHELNFIELTLVL